MQSYLLATTIAMFAASEQPTNVISNSYTVDVKHRKGTYKASFGPGLGASLFTKKQVGFRDTIFLHGKEFEIRAVMEPDEQVKDYRIDLILGPEVLKEFAIRIEPFRRRSAIFLRSELSKQITGMTLLDPPRGDLEEKVEPFQLDSFGGFDMIRIMELPACGVRVRGLEFVHGALGFRPGKRIVYRVDEEKITAAGFADLPFQSVVYDFKTGALYAADPVPAYVPTFFSVVRQPMEFKQGKLYLVGDDKPVVQVQGLPIGTYCEFLRADALKATFEQGYLTIGTEGGMVRRLPVISK